MTDTITLPRSVLEQALEILDSLLPATTKDYFPAWLPQDAIDSLKCRDSVRAALEQPQVEQEQPQVEQEPVAWMYDWDADGAPVRDWVSRDYGEAHSPTNGCHNIRPLYTHPQPRQPLTDEAVRKLIPPWAAWKYEVGHDEAIKFARAVEAAHGIGGEK